MNLENEHVDEEKKSFQKITLEIGTEHEKY